MKKSKKPMPMKGGKKKMPMMAKIEKKKTSLKYE